MPSAGPKIVVVGSCNTDLVVEVPRIPFPGETVLGGALRTVAGGKGANQAVAAARLGGDIVLVGRVGDDAYGAATRDGLIREGIDDSFLRVTPGVASGVALIAVHAETGENAIVVAPGANALLTAEDIEEAAAAFDDAQVILLSLEVPLAAVTRAAAMAAERRIPVILNPAPARTLPASLLSQVTILTPNETEARLIAGFPVAKTQTPIDMVANALLRTEVDASVITLGAAGALIVTHDGLTPVSAYAVQAVDTVAAGDCFTAALAVETAAGQPLPDAARFASMAAGLKVTRRGAQSGLPYRAEVERLLVALPKG